MPSTAQNPRQPCIDPTRTTPTRHNPVLGINQLLPRGSLPLGARKRHAERETHHAATVTHGESCHAAESWWTAPPLRVERRSVGQFYRRETRAAGAVVACVLQLVKPQAACSWQRFAYVESAIVLIAEPHGPYCTSGPIMMTDKRSSVPGDRR